MGKAMVYGVKRRASWPHWRHKTLLIHGQERYVLVFRDGDGKGSGLSWSEGGQRCIAKSEKLFSPGIFCS